MEAEINKKIHRGDTGTDVGFYESLLQQLKAHMARVGVASQQTTCSSFGLNKQPATWVAQGVNYARSFGTQTNGFPPAEGREEEVQCQECSGTYVCSSSSLKCATPMRCDCEVRIISHCKLLICAGQAEGQAPGHAEKEAIQAETDGTQVVKFSFISRLFTWYISSSELCSIRRNVDYFVCANRNSNS